MCGYLSGQSIELPAGRDCSVLMFFVAVWLQVLERGERIELLVQSTDNLQTQAFSFKRDAGRLQRSMWWKNVRTQVMSSHHREVLCTDQYHALM